MVWVGKISGPRGIIYTEGPAAIAQCNVVENNSTKILFKPVLIFCFIYYYFS